MPRFAITLFWLSAMTGCATTTAPVYPPGYAPASVCQNPVFVPVADHEFVWETTADVIDDYFPIEREEPVRRLGDVLTEGRLDTLPVVGATFFEPWRHDSSNLYQRIESTLQTIRRRAVVRVVPGAQGYWVDVAVFKELEDMPQPEQSTHGSATFRNDSSLTRVVNPIGVQETPTGWIERERDTALEQRILSQLVSRTGSAWPR